MTGNPKTVYLKDYCPPAYRVESVELRFELDEQDTTVHAKLLLHANHDRSHGVQPLVLDGQDLELLSIALDGEPLSEKAYRVDGAHLTIDAPPESFTLETVVRIHPAANTALEGLYVSGGNFCTQCEAEGFRKITWFPDRPDVMAVFTATLVADPARYPVLLSNGNPVEEGKLEDGRHFATWHDPFPKPCYLFALVAGDLKWVEDRFTTTSGREVELRIYVRAPDLDKCDHAMRSLKAAMAWDEENYGREYDLDRYNIVAVSDFNMGAMENKGLNIFNSHYVLASPETATDTDFVNIEAVIAHEYFHNWSGNRVTCRDWFQLSLKEGFTVFRDAQFTADRQSAAVKRIEDARLLRARQFAEDAGPMAHPVRPDAYVEINNFYTLTVYEKGAEVVRMLHTLLGPERFRRGTDRYFERHDGQAVTVEDFIRALEEANGVELTQFQRWYAQAGTPVVSVERLYDAETRRFRLTLRQSCPPTPGQPEKAPFHIPVKIALLRPDGTALPVRLEGESGGELERVLELTESEQTFTFVDLPEPPIPSLLRAFSAPVKLEVDWSDAELAFLLAHDTDEFNRWDAGQRLGVRVMLRAMERLAAGRTPDPEHDFVEAFGRALAAYGEMDPALLAEALTLPSEEYVADFTAPIDPDRLYLARTDLRRLLATAHRDLIEKVYDKLADTGPFRLDAAAIGRRRLRNLCLSYLAELGDAQVQAITVQQFDAATNMTDSVAALTALVHTGAAQQAAALNSFYGRWKEEPGVLDKWFAIQAASPQPGALERVQQLVEHPDFTLKNPNRVRAVIGTFCMRNHVRFHEVDGGGYRFLADQVLTLDRMNPQIAARMLTPLTLWRRYEPVRSDLMKTELERIAGSEGLSPDTYEVVTKSLA